MKVLAVVLGLLGIVVGMAAVVYLTVPAHSLPSLLGPVPHGNEPRTQRGEAAVAAAVVLLVLSGVLFFVTRGPSSERRSVLSSAARLWSYLLGRGDR